MLTVTRQSVLSCWFAVTACVILTHRPSMKQKTNNPFSVSSKHHLWERKLHSKETCAVGVIPPRAASCYKAGKLTFPRSRRSSDPAVTGRLIKRGSGSSWGDRHSGELANYLGVLYRLKFLNSPTWRGPGRSDIKHRWPRKKWEGRREDGGEHLLVVSFMGTGL